MFDINIEYIDINISGLLKKGIYNCYKVKEKK